MNSRRNFIKKTAVFGVGASLIPNLTFGINDGVNVEKLKIGMIGVGLRGTNHLNNLLLRDDVVITAICDIDSIRTDIAVDKITKKGQKKPLVFGKEIGRAHV